MYKCIDDTFIDSLTEGKLYIIIDVEKNIGNFGSFGLVTVKNDLGEIQEYFTRRFLSIKLERREKLEKLNNVDTI